MADTLTWIRNRCFILCRPHKEAIHVDAWACVVLDAWCLVALTLEAALVAEFADSTNSSALRAADAVMFLYVGGFQGCLNGTQWAFVSEIWPSHLRPKGLAKGLVAIMVTNICFVQAAPTAFEYVQTHVLQFPLHVSRPSLTHSQEHWLAILSGLHHPKLCVHIRDLFHFP